MGISQSQDSTIYLYRISTKCQSSQYKVTHVDSIKNVQWNQCLKLIMPIDQAYHIRDILRKMHHKVILLKCGFSYEGLFKSQFNYIQINSFDQFNKNFQTCVNYHLPHQNCPVSVIFDNLHQTRMKNFQNAFNFYNIESLYFTSVQQFIQTKCQTCRIICGKNELDRILQCIQNKIYVSNNDLKINVFCDKQNEYEMIKTQQLAVSLKVAIEYNNNFLKIIECLVHRSIIPHNEKIKIENIYYLIDENSKGDGSLNSSLKRIQKNLRNIKLKKISDIKNIPKKMSHNILNTLIIDKSIKTLIDVCNILQENGLQDRVCLIRRDNEINDQFTNRIIKYCQDNFYLGLKKSLKSAIVIGSPTYAKYILRSVYCIEIKLFIDQNNQNDIEDALNRKNQIIIISSKCVKYIKQNIRYNSIIICYDEADKLQNSIVIYSNKNYLKFCTSEEDVEKVLKGDILPYRLNYQFQKKKRSYIGQYFYSIFKKLMNKQFSICFNRDQEIIFFQCQSWVIETISNTMVKLFSNKYISNYIVYQCFLRIKQLILDEICFLNRIDTVEEEVVQNILKFYDQNSYQNCEIMITQFSTFIMHLFIKYQKFRKAINQIFRSILYQNKIGQIQFTPCLVFILLLSFSKLNKVQACSNKVITLQVLSPTIKGNEEQIQKFLQKNSLNYIYCAQFLYCKEIQDNQTSTSLVFQLQSEELNNYTCYSSYFKQNNAYIIPPLTKLKVSHGSKNMIIKLSSKYQQKFFQKFSSRFIEGQEEIKSQLFKETIKYDSFCDYIKLMESKKYVSAHVLIFKMEKEAKDKKIDLYSAYHTITLIKRGFYSQAKKNLKVNNPFHQFLSNYLQKCQQDSKRSVSRYSQKKGKQKWVVNYLPLQEKFAIINQQTQSLSVFTEIQFESYSKSKFKENNQQVQFFEQPDEFDKMIQDRQQIQNQTIEEQQKLIYKIHQPLQTNFNHNRRDNNINNNSPNIFSCLLLPKNTQVNSNISKRLTGLRNSVYHTPVALFKQKQNLQKRSSVHIYPKNSLTQKTSSFQKFKNQFHVQLKKINENDQQNLYNQ